MNRQLLKAMAGGRKAGKKYSQAAEGAQDALVRLIGTDGAGSDTAKLVYFKTCIL